MHSYDEIRQLIDRVRRRWRALRAFQASVRTALVASAVVGAAMLVARWTEGAPLALALLGGAAVASLIAVAAWGLSPLRHVPDDRNVARFIEEREPALDDRLISAVDVAAKSSTAAGFAEPMMADA